LRKVSVILSTYTTKKLVDVSRCIASLKKQTLEPSEIILVVDRRELMWFYRKNIPKDVRIVLSNGIGVSQARNTGIRNAKEQFVAFIDDDAMADRDWLENLCRNFDDPEVYCVGGFVEPIWEKKCPEWFPEELNWIIGCAMKGLPIRKASIRNPMGCNMSFRKDVFETAGFFNPNFGKLQGKSIIGEELDLCRRISQKVSKSKVIYEPSAIVYHRVPNNRTTLTYVFTRSFFEGLSKAIIENESKEINVLSVENDFRKYLLRVSIPSKLRLIHRREKLLQLLAILVSMFSVFVGYGIGKCARIKRSQFAHARIKGKLSNAS